jgi:hypothetical protein
VIGAPTARRVITMVSYLLLPSPLPFPRRARSCTTLALPNSVSKGATRRDPQCCTRTSPTTIAWNRPPQRGNAAENSLLSFTVGGGGGGGRAGRRARGPKASALRNERHLPPTGAIHLEPHFLNGISNGFTGLHQSARHNQERHTVRRHGVRVVRHGARYPEPLLAQEERGGISSLQRPPHSPGLAPGASGAVVRAASRLAAL